MIETPIVTTIETLAETPGTQTETLTGIPTEIPETTIVITEETIVVKEVETDLIVLPTLPPLIENDLTVHTDIKQTTKKTQIMKLHILWFVLCKGAYNINKFRLKPQVFGIVVYKET